MKVYMIRHGQSEANLNRLHSGWGEVPLTPKGEEDAKGAAEILKNYSFDKVYSSDILRAMQTQKIALPNYEAELCDLVREINVGSLSGISFEDCEKEFGEKYIELRSLGDFRSFGGEDHPMHAERMRKFLDKLSTENFENVAVFTHAGAIRRTLELLQDSEYETRVIDNCGIFLFEYEDGKWSFISEITE